MRPALMPTCRCRYCLPRRSLLSASDAVCILHQQIIIRPVILSSKMQETFEFRYQAMNSFCGNKMFLKLLHGAKCEKIKHFIKIRNLLLVCVSWTILVSHETASSSAECSRDKLPFSFVRGQDSTMWDIIWVSPQWHRSVSVSRHFLLQAPQCFCSVRKRFSRDHCCRGRSKPSCWIVGSRTMWELTTWADFQLCLHRLLNFLMSTGCKYGIKRMINLALLRLNLTADTNVLNIIYYLLAL